MTLIAFVGSVFSPYYRRALQRDPATAAQEHCAINVCLYSPGARRWTMTERSARHVQRDAKSFSVGPSRMAWTGAHLEMRIDERARPWPHPVRGAIRVHPIALSHYQTPLDAAGAHRWGPIAPCARIEVELQEPALRWQGQAYLDSNEGDEPIERAFARWDWLRAPLSQQRCAVVYDVQPREGPARVIAATFGADGRMQPAPAPPRVPLPASRLWRVARTVRADAAAVQVQRTLEDTPFYTRSLLAMQLAGERVQAVHESLDVPRLISPWVQRLLPFRMPRRA